MFLKCFLRAHANSSTRGLLKSNIKPQFSNRFYKVKQMTTSWFDDSVIDKIIWEEIAQSTSKGDFVCYMIHEPIGSRHRDEAKARMASIGPQRDIAPASYGRAVERIRQLAESGDPVATFHMGKIHALGISIPQNLPLAVEWYEKAMALGDPRSHANLGWFYQSGYGVPVNKKRAFELLSFGADNGIHSAKATIGIMRLTGEGCDANPELGLLLLEEAFDAGVVAAGNHLADTYFAGTVVRRDMEKGHEWLFRVAEQGDERTMAILGHYLVAGTHGKTDIPRGLSLLEAAIEKEYLPAFLWVGSLYKNGTGVEQDTEKAAQWYQRGIEAGNFDCVAALALLENESARDGSPETLH